MKSTSTLSNIQTCITKKNSMTTQNFTILNNENTLKELNKNNFNNKKKSPILPFQHITTHPISLWNALETITNKLHNVIYKMVLKPLIYQSII